MASETKRAEPRKRPGAFACFPMGRIEALALTILILFSIVSFLPVWRDIQLAGMSVFGWLMAALMLISPVLMLLVFRRGPGRGR
jgi:hypothetical protein